MKTLKKILSAILVCCMLLSLCACHGKDEVALTIENVDITSALYLKALIDADAKAKQRVDEQIAAAQTEENATQTEETDYYSQSLDGLAFKEYVKAEAIKLCKEYAFFQKLVDAKTITIDDAAKSEIEYSAQYQWVQGEAYIFENNGVSFETYEKAYTYSYCSQKYFELLYKEGGEKEVPKEDIKKNMTENYVLVYALPAEYEENATDDQKAETKKKLEGYEKRLKDGEDFEKIYMEHNNLKAEDHKHTETEDGPKLQHAVVLVDKDHTTHYNYNTPIATPSVDFDAVYDMKVNETTIIENEEKTGITLYVKLNISTDEYYLKLYTDEILRDLKDEEYQKSITTATANYKVTENSFAVDRFDVEDIDYSALEEAYAAAAANANTAA